MRRRTGHHLAGPGQRLQPARHVHHVAHGRVVAADPERADEHLAGVDADPQLDLGAEVGRRAGQRPLHLQGGPHRPLGVVLVGHRRAEQRDDGVAHDLVDPPAVRPHVGHQSFEAAVDQVLHLLGVAGLGQRREADQICEQDRHDASLVRTGAEGLAAGGAEAGTLGDLGPAGQASHRRQA